MIQLSWEHLSVRWIWLYLSVISHTHCRVNPHYKLYISLNVKELFAPNTRNISTLSDWTDTRNYKHLVPKQLSSICPNWPNDWPQLWAIICTVHLTVYSCHVMYVFQRESTLYICLNVKELLAPNRRNISSLSDRNGTRTQNHLVHKRTLKHLVKLTKWLRWVVSTYLYGPFDCISLSSHVPISEWIHTLCLPECQETPYSKKVRYMKFKWRQRDSNPQPVSS